MVKEKQENNSSSDVASDATTLLNFIEEVTSNCAKEQDRVLAEILRQNGEVEYLKRYGSPKDKETFKCRVPIVSYDDIREDILRIANGDFSPILCASPITEFYVSSGTSSGVPNLIPVTAESMKRKCMVYRLVEPVIAKYIDGIEKGKALNILVSHPQFTTPGGLIMGSVTAAYLRSKYFMDIVNDTYTSPIESIHCVDPFQSLYTQLLCAIYQRHDVTQVGASFAGTLIMFLKFFQTHYSEICHDIATGELSSKITDPSLRARMLDTFMNDGPNVELAEFVNAACNGGNWEGIIPKIWPNVKYLEARVTGSMAQYIPSLEFYGGGLPLVSHRYGFSECTCGVNMNPISKPYTEAAFTFIPNVAYFEFLPVVSDEDEQDKVIMRPSHITDTGGDQVVDLAHVQIGQDYELLVTTYDGLYRYRVEDVLCATGFYNSTPQFKFVRRKNVVLNINGDKTTESDLFKAIGSVSNILQPFNTMVLEYTSYVDVASFPPHYVIYLELFSKDGKMEIEDEVLGQCCLAMENCLNMIYRLARRSSMSIGPLEIRVVKSGGFTELRDYAISRGTSLAQYKVPRCLKRLPMVQLLDSAVISSHFSPSSPCTKLPSIALG